MVHFRARGLILLACRPIVELGEDPSRGFDGDPAERPEPTNHGDGNYAQIADRENPS
jgi:hypothetical protein